MELQRNQFIQLVRKGMGLSAQFDRSADSIDWETVWGLARWNHLEVIVGRALEECPDVPEHIRTAAADIAERMRARAIFQELFLQQIEGSLKNAKIPYGVLKGTILKHDYPSVSCRFMSDLDFYIRPEDKPAVTECMHKLGGKDGSPDAGDIEFHFDGGVTAEFHGRLVYRKSAFQVECYPEWSLVDKASDRLTEEGYALNLIGHAVGDMARQGAGVRFVLDLWVYRHRHEPQPDWNMVFSRLEADGIAKISRNLFDLSEYLFGDRESIPAGKVPLMEEMAEYILDGGLYGNNARKAAIENAMAGGKVKTLTRQIFRSQDEFENRYPWLKKKPFLLPAAWIMRIAQTWNTRKGVVKQWLKRMDSVTPEEVNEQREKMRRFGL